MRAGRRRYAGKIAAADLGKAATRAQCPVADSPGGNPEDPRHCDDAKCQGPWQHSSRDRFAPAGVSVGRQADVLLLWQRCVLLDAEALAGAADDGPALWNGNAHLRDANCAWSIAGRLFSAGSL